MLDKHVMSIMEDVRRSKRDVGEFADRHKLLGFAQPILT